MSAWIRRVISRLWNALRPQRAESDLDREIGAHLALLEEDFIRRGLTPDEARTAARRALGGVEQTRQLHQTARSFSAIDNARRDLRYAVRSLRRAPGFTAVAIVTLALGIGANTAIFSLIYSALLRPLPYATSGRVLLLTEGSDGNAVTLGNFGSWRERTHEFEALGAWYNSAATLSVGSETTRLSALRATAGIWRVLEAKPAAGRYYTVDDDRPDAAPVVVLSYHLWQTRFDANPGVIGSSILLDGAPRAVVGVASPAYEQAGLARDLWLPAAMTPAQLAEHSDHELTVYGLLRPGATADTSVAELRRIEEALGREYPRAGLDGIVRAQDLRSAIVGDSKRNLLILTAAVAFVLLIACANLTNLLLGRAATRQKEIALRAALGATRRRIVAQLLIESLVLAVAGGAAGVGLASLGFETFVAAASTSLVTLHPTINAAVLAYAAALALVCSVLFGLTPALRASRTDVQGTLRDAGARGGSVGEAGRRSLVVFELVLAVMLLVGAGLLIRSAMALQHVPLGFETRDRATTRVALPSARYRDGAAIAGTFDQILEKVAAIPGVRSAALVSRLPMMQGANCNVVVQGRTEGGPVTNFRSATPQYFPTMGVPVLGGRLFDRQDAAGGPAVTVINDVLAHRLFGSANPLGARVALCPQMGSGQPHWLEVIGVVGAMRSNGLRQDLPAELFVPMAQSPGNLTMSLVVESPQPIGGLAPAIRRAVHDIDPLVPVFSVQMLENLAMVDQASSQFITELLVALGVTGLILAVIGVYGVVAYFVSQRTHEIGVRVAMGASTRQVVALVLRQGLTLALVGVGLGTLAALATSTLLESFLYGVTARDPLTVAGSAVILILVAVAASAIPARRAARVDPVATLRA